MTTIILRGRSQRLYIAVLLIVVLLPAFAWAGDALDLLGQVESACATVAALTDDAAGAAGLLALEGAVKVLESQLPYSKKELNALKQSYDSATKAAELRNTKLEKLNKDPKATQTQKDEAINDYFKWAKIEAEREKKYNEARDFQANVQTAIVAARECIAKQWKKVRASTPDKGASTAGGKGGSVDLTKVNDLGNKFRNQQPGVKQPSSKGGTGMGGTGLGGGPATPVAPPVSTTSSSGTVKAPNGSESGYELPTVTHGQLTNIWVYCDPKRIKINQQRATCKAYAGIRLGNAYPPEISSEVVWSFRGPFDKPGLQTITASKGWINGSDTVWVEDTASAGQNSGGNTPSTPPATGGGSKVPPPSGGTNSCLGWDYSPWSVCRGSGRPTGIAGECYGTQSRTATGAPAGCTGTPPSPLQQQCVYAPSVPNQCN